MRGRDARTLLTLFTQVGILLKHVCPDLCLSTHHQKKNLEMSKVSLWRFIRLTKTQQCKRILGSGSWVWPHKIADILVFLSCRKDSFYKVQADNMVDLRYAVLGSKVKCDSVCVGL